MSNNGSLGGIVDDADFAAFDALPAEIRRAFAEAPYDLAFGDVAGQLAAFEAKHGRALDAEEIAFAVDAIAEEHRFELEVTAFALYGPDHPQARVVDTECLLDLNLLSVSSEMKRWRAGTPEQRAEALARFRSGAAFGPAPVRIFRNLPADDGFVALHAMRPQRRRGRVANRAFADRAAFNPRRDAIPVHADAAAALIGDPPIGRRALDQVRS